MTTPAMSASREYVASPDGDVNLSIIEHEESVNTDINESEKEIVDSAMQSEQGFSPSLELDDNVNRVMDSEEVFSHLLEPGDNVCKHELDSVNSTTKLIEVPEEWMFQ